MFKAKNPDQTTYTYRGKRYSLWDAFPGKTEAAQLAKDLRTLMGGLHQTTYTRAIVVDLGKGAGRLRYGVFTAAGRPI